MNRPAGIPPSYVETSPGIWCHPSRVCRVEAGLAKPDGGAALEREAPAPEGGATRVGAGNRGERHRPVPAAGPAVVVTLLALLRREFEQIAAQAWADEAA